MAVTITVDENSYISLADADDYFKTRLNSDTWTNATDEDKKKALITATKHIDYYNFIGRKENADQPLEFPRTYFHDITPFYQYDQEITDGEKPDELLDATCEEAIALLAQNTAIDEKQQQGIESESIGDTSRSYNSDVVKSKQRGRGLVSSEAKALLRGHIESTVRLM